MNTLMDYPVPHADVDNTSFLEAWKERGEILLQKAAVGGKPYFYPRPICPYTGSLDLVNVTSTGKGKIVSFSLVRRPNHPAFNEEVPIILAEVELEEGALMLARIICENADKVACGLMVETLKLPVASRYPLPTFKLVFHSA